MHLIHNCTEFSLLSTTVWKEIASPNPNRAWLHIYRFEDNELAAAAISMGGQPFALCQLKKQGSSFLFDSQTPWDGSVYACLAGAGLCTIWVVEVSYYPEKPKQEALIGRSVYSTK